jgi:hypothetical protein
MILWSIQTIAAWQELSSVGVLRGNPRYVDDTFLPAYQWMVQQMRHRIGPPDYPATLPVWAWYQWESLQRPRPDLRAAGHLAPGERGVRITCEVADQRVLLSDFELWHYVLNNWYIPCSEADAQQFEAECDACTSSAQQSALSDCRHLQQQITASWGRIFDIEWEEEYCTYKRAEKSIQATLWELRLEDVRNIKEFTAK